MFGAVVETEPDALATLDYDKIESSNTRVVLLWTSLPTHQNGGSEVLGYKLRYRKADVEWQTIEVGATETTYTVTGLLGGTNNFFTIAPFNKYGVALHTTELSVIAA